MNRRRPLRLARASRTSSLLRDTRGASMVEYALLLVLVMAGVSPVLRSLGTTASHAFEAAVAQFGP